MYRLMQIAAFVCGKISDAMYAGSLKAAEAEYRVNRRLEVW